LRTGCWRRNAIWFEDGLPVYNQEMAANEELHRLVDMLPEAERPLASRFLHFLVESGGDAPLSDEDWAAVHEGEAEIARGEFVTLADLKHELDL
jgi:hypothetical protein